MREYAFTIKDTFSGAAGHEDRGEQ